MKKYYIISSAVNFEVSEKVKKRDLEKLLSKFIDIAGREFPEDFRFEGSTLIYPSRDMKDGPVSIKIVFETSNMVMLTEIYPG